MSESSNISNNAGPGSAAEPSMEEILASIRRILREDETTRVPAPVQEPDDDVLVLNADMVADGEDVLVLKADIVADNDDVLVLNSSMVAEGSEDELLLDSTMILPPADISSATEMPVDTGLIAAHDEAPLTTYHEPVHFASEPTIDTHMFDQTVQLSEAEVEAVLAAAEPAPLTEPERVPEPVAAAPVPVMAPAPPPPEPVMAPAPPPPEPVMAPAPRPPEPVPEPEPAAPIWAAPVQAAPMQAAPAPKPYFEEEAAMPHAAFAPMPRLQKEETVMETQVQSPDFLIGEAAESAVANTIGTLMRSISKDRAVSVRPGGLTIEDIVREEIKPVLKAWFDTHLPSLVERIVRAEVGRVIDRTQV